jgi:DNA-directed RNA polymerase subunit RPC12/RpoP
LSEDKSREEGFKIFRNGLVRRLSSTHYVAKNAANEPWCLIELREGRWDCDCKSAEPPCAHLYAAQLQRTTSRLPPDTIEETLLKCRYCSSPDITSCGFRYNARGIARRYRCNDCQRKFSIPHVQGSPGAKPSELVWLLNQLGMLTSKLTELLDELNLRLESIGGTTEAV